MDRGLGNYYRGNARRDERRYDDFYERNNRRGGGANFRGGSGGGNRNGRGGGRDRGFFGNQGNNASGSSGSNHNVITALQLQQSQNLLNAYIRNQSGQGATNFPNNGPRKGGYNTNFRSGDKRRQEPSSSSSFKKSKPSRDTSKDERRSSSTSRSSTTHKNRESSSRKEEPKEKREETPDIPDDQVEIPDQLMDNVEKLRQRKDVERNVADEDIEKLVVFCFNGKGHDCLTCGYMLLKDSAFKNHLMSKSHVMNVIDARSDKKYQQTRDLLDIDIADDGWFEKCEMARKVLYKQAKVMMKVDLEKKKRELESYNRDPSNFFAINMASKKCATMTGDVVRITSIVESTIDVKEFSKNRFFGCEFVKSVASFQCRLCDMKIHNASEVLPHIDSRVHRNKYQMHLRRMPEYEKKQKEQNKDLEAILQEHEGQAVLLSETNTKSSDEDDQGKTLLEEIDTIMVRVPEILNPPEKEKPKEKESEEKTEDTEVTEVKEESQKEEDEANNEENGNEGVSADQTNGNDETEVIDEPKRDEETIETNEKEQHEEQKPEALTETEKTEEVEVKTEDANVEAMDPATEEPEVEKEEVAQEKPAAKKKRGSIGRGRGVARRGTPKRSRGGKAVGSPKTRSKPVTDEQPTPEAETPTEDVPKEDALAEETEKPTEEKDESMDASDGNFMDGFQVVDEVQEE